MNSDETQAPYDPGQPGPPREVHEDAAAREQSMTAEERVDRLTEAWEFNPGEKQAIEGALRDHAEQARKEERELWAPLYTLAAEIMIHHEAFMAAWRDKFSPDAIKAVEQHRAKLFEACAQVREATGLDGKQIEQIAIRARSEGESQ